VKFTLFDTTLIATFVALCSIGFMQACGNDGPIAPGSPGDPNSKPDRNAPVAVLSVVGAEEGPTPFTVHVDGSGSYDPDGDPIEHHWFFSDGSEADGVTAENKFRDSGRHQVRLVVTDRKGRTGESESATVYGYGLANSPWPKFAHDERNTGVTSDNNGPEMDLQHADEGKAFKRYWVGKPSEYAVKGVCVGYDGMVVYAQGKLLRALTAEGVELWNMPVDNDIYTWPAIAHDGSIIFGAPGMLFRVAKDGHQIWAVELIDSTQVEIVPDTAVTIDHQSNIYLAGFLANPGGGLPRGRLVAISIDGAVKWIKPISNLVHRLVPAISPDGSIVINGLGGLRFSPSGEKLAEFVEYYPESENVIDLAPPAINPDGIIAFGSMVFYPDGILKEYIAASSNLNMAAGNTQAPVWDDQSINLVGVWDDDGALLTHSSTGDDSMVYAMNQGYPFDAEIGGASEDASGKVYWSYYGVRAASPLISYSIAPYTRRYSLWSYPRPSARMTPPVIGGDGWLYVGYGGNIMAFGD